MKPITGETTFKEIRDLLEKEDKDFIAICKRIKEKKDISYDGPIYYFDFLMAVVLGGVSRSTQYQKTFYIRTAVVLSLVHGVKMP